MNYININSESDIDSIIEKSVNKLQIIFKHSTVCPISRMANEKMDKLYNLPEESADVYYVGVIEQRPISNYIAEKLNVKHESPQAILIKDKKAVFNESHLMINPEVFKEYL